MEGIEGIPKLYQSFTEGEYHGMAMELLGPSIEGLTNVCGGHLELPTVLVLAVQMIERVEAFHSKGYLHRDIKPDNFSIGRGDKNKIAYIIDYGLVKKYRNPKTKSHIPLKKNKKLTGTARYASIFTHKGYEQSRRDDLECLGYTFIHMAKGSLPWQGIKAEEKKEKYRKIMEKKCGTPLEILCKGLPIEFMNYIDYCRTLQFEDKPNYSQLKNYFRDYFNRHRLNLGFVFDWVRLKIDLSSYKKKEDLSNINKKDVANISSNKAEADNNESLIKRAQSKDVNKLLNEETKLLEVSKGKRQSIQINDPYHVLFENIESYPSIQENNKESNNRLQFPNLKDDLLNPEKIINDKITNKRKRQIEKLLKGFPSNAKKVVKKQSRINGIEDLPKIAEMPSEETPKINTEIDKSGKSMKVQLELIKNCKILNADDNQEIPKHEEKVIIDEEKSLEKDIKDKEKTVKNSDIEKNIDVTLNLERSIEISKLMAENGYDDKQESYDFQLQDTAEKHEIFGNHHIHSR